MLITFDDEGCRMCPFVLQRFGQDGKFYKATECNLELNGYIKKLKEPVNFAKKPEGCPFKGFPGNLEIQARNSK